MDEKSRKLEVLIPSTGSLGLAIGCTFAAILFLVAPLFGGNFLPRLLFGQEASQALISTSQSDYGDVILGIFANDFVGRAIVFATWMFIGLVVFIILNIAGYLLGELNASREELGYVHQKKSELFQNAGKAFLFKIAVAAVWSGLLMLAFRTVINYFAMTGFVALDDGSPRDWLLFIVAILVLMIMVHLQVVMARLLIGRVRLWGNP